MHLSPTLLASLFLLSLTFAGRLSAQGIKAVVREEKPGLLAKAKVKPDVATATAQAKFPKAKVRSAEIEEEHGKVIYSFDLKTEGKSGIDEVNVDAMSGEVLAVEHESPKAEAKEKAADARKHPKKPN